MSCLESEFIREFKFNTSNIGSKDIYSLPLPKGSDKWYISGTELYIVKDLEGEYIDKLNGKIVRKIPSGVQVKKRKIDKATRNFVFGENGYEYEEYTIPTGCMLVISDQKLGLPYNFKADNFSYIDYSKKKDGTLEYFYCVPKTCLYKIHQTALAISVKNMKNYAGKGYITWKSGVIFIHVIPYSPGRSYIGSKILKTGVGLDYNSEIESIVDTWKNLGIIPMINLCDTVEYGNIALKETAVGYEDYDPYESISIGDMEIYGTEEAPQGEVKDV